jgi:transcriptional repressor NrdR
VRCPRCQSDGKQSIEDTKPQPDGQIRRRRRCSDCREHYTTIEMISDKSLRVRKLGGSVVPFDRDAVRKGITRATLRKHHKHAYAELEDLVEHVASEAYVRSKGGIISSQDVGRLVLEHLKHLDEASHVRFALAHLGGWRRSDDPEGWLTAEDVRSWLLEEYPELDQWRPPGKLVTVVKRSGEHQRFDRAKLEQSIGYAAKGRRSHDEIQQLATDVARQVQRALRDQPIVTSGQLAAEALRILRDDDHIAYLRYASAAKNFREPKDFESEAVAILNRGGKSPVTRRVRA